MSIVEKGGQNCNVELECYWHTRERTGNHPDVHLYIHTRKILFQLKNLKEATNNEYQSDKPYILVYFTKGCKEEYSFARSYTSNDLYRKSNYYKEFVLVVNDDELYPRMLKVWLHLAYLAGEIRKKEIEESGDKF